MTFTWIVVGLAGWALALVFVLLLMRMAGQQDRAARHGEKKLDPFSDVTITELEKPKFMTAFGGGPMKEKAPKAALPQPKAEATDRNASDAPKDSH